jgi:CubicO group peptidase (beta-lactamase class C family)
MVKKFIKRFAWGLLGLLVLVALVIQLTGHGYFWKALSATYLQGHSTAHIDDAGNFAQRKIATTQPLAWEKDAVFNKEPLNTATLSYLQQYKSAAFVVAKNGKLLHETYFAPYTENSKTNSFSMAKTVTTMQIGLAVQQGLIPSFDAPITQFLPEYVGNARASKATISQISAMKAGHDWTENYKLPFNVTTDLYFGKDAEKLVLNQNFEREPNTEFEYSSGSTQVLGVILKRAIQKKNPQSNQPSNISEHLSQSLWQPLGMEQDAIYTLDRAGEDGGMERTYCCIFATARDYAKLGQLLLQDGQWGGKQLLDKAFVERMRKPDLKPYYGHSLWMDWTYKHPFYSLQGHQGQYVIVVPSLQLVVVRVGQYRNKALLGPNGRIPLEVYSFVDEAVRLAQATAPAK